MHDADHDGIRTAGYAARPLVGDVGVLYEDRTIICRDCAQPFNFTAREQAFFAERGFTPPIRCIACRRAHKARRQQSESANEVNGTPPPPGDVPGQRERERGAASRTGETPPRDRRQPSELPPERGSRPAAGGRDDHYTLDWADVMPPVVNSRGQRPDEFGWDDRAMVSDGDDDPDGRDRRVKRRRGGGRTRRDERHRERYDDDWDD